MTDIDMFFNTLEMNSLAIGKLLGWMKPNLHSGGNNFVMLYGHFESLNAYYSLKNKFPELSAHNDYNEMVEIVKSKIRGMETHTVLQHFLENTPMNLT